MIELRVLGPLEVTRDGEPVRIPGVKERALLALLAIHGARFLALGRADCVGVIVTKKPGYAFQVERGSIDADRFEGFVRRATDLGTDNPSRASELLAEALSLWRGAPYGDLEFEDLAQPERARLEELRVAAMEQMIAADLALGRTSKALAELTRLVCAHPLRERLRGQLMLGLYRAGRQGDAIAAYQEARRVLDEELGLDPGSELEKVYLQILRQDPSLEPTSQPSASAPRTNIPARVTSFIGQQAAIQEVTALVRDNRLVTVTGPGGAGKTSLAIEVGRGLLDAFDRGVWLVELAPVSDAGRVVGAIADTLGLSEDASSGSQTQPAIATLSACLRNKDLLLVLDNCEHLVQAVAETVEALLTTCPKVRILATSREVLTTSGEFVWTIPPLSVPRQEADLHALRSYDAIRLFGQRRERRCRGCARRGERQCSSADLQAPGRLAACHRACRDESESASSAGDRAQARPAVRVADRRRQDHGVTPPDAARGQSTGATTC